MIPARVKSETSRISLVYAITSIPTFSIVADAAVETMVSSSPPVTYKTWIWCRPGRWDQKHISPASQWSTKNLLVQYQYATSYEGSRRHGKDVR